MSYNKMSNFPLLLPQSKLASVVAQWLDEDIPSFDWGAICVGSQDKKASLYLKAEVSSQTCL
jgi:nicotinate-nucleotide pyrophosphorylase